MGMDVAIWLVGGAIALMVMLIVVVTIARSMDKGGPAIKTNIPRPLAQALGYLGEKNDDPETDKSKKRKAALFSALGAVALIGGFVHFAKGLNDGDFEPAVSEITAGALHGTLVDKRRRDPVVLIVPGSGPTDRDGNSPLGVKADSYKLLAEALIEEDIASVRIDKRGSFASAGTGDPSNISSQAYVGDIHAWIDAIKAERGSKCVFLLGHSEGALMVSLAAEGRKDVCGLILVSGMGRTFGAVLREQLTANPANAPVLDQAMRAIDDLEAGRDVDVTGKHPALLPLFGPAVQPYLKSLINIDPVEAVRRANKQTLILQGTRDIQVSVEDARLLNKAPKTKLRLIDNLNHILKEAPEDRGGNIATYANPSLPLAKGLVKQIEDFIDDND